MNSIYNVFIDEAGMTPYYNDKAQPVMTIVGVITKSNHDDFNFEIVKLLNRYSLQEDVEIHTNHLIKGETPFEKLGKEKAEDLLYDFLTVGIKFIDFVHFVGGMLKPFVNDEMRENLGKRNLDTYLNSLYYFMIFLDIAFVLELNSEYQLFFDASDNFNNQTNKMVMELSKKSENYFLRKLNGPPNKMDSKNNRFIQLADAMCFILTRYRQIEVRTFKKSQNLNKYEPFLTKCYNEIKAKILPYIGLINTDACLKIFNPKELLTRDFSHMGNWTSKRRKEDFFDPYVSNYWGPLEEKKEILNNVIEEILNRNGDAIPLNPEKIAQLKRAITALEKIMEKTSVSEKRRDTYQKMEMNIKRIKQVILKRTGRW